jgi:cellulose synthase/poly-beta-1,6-N-acetylglucosamine synthase-like glycosyltransferase
MAIAKIIFWACLFLIAYTYFLYPILLFSLYAAAQVWRDLRYLGSRRSRRPVSPSSEELPAVSVLIPAHNEAACLHEKIANLRNLDYPAEKLEIIFVSDGSTDGTNDFLKALPDANIRLIILPERKGKANALNHAVAQARNEILIFSDASTLFARDAVRTLVRHFSDATVGAACGALQFEGTPEAQQTEGFYWKYEGMLRFMEARLGATLTASGAIYALRRECYRPLPQETLIEDFLVPMNTRKQGYRVLYDPEALATDFPASTVGGEFARRVRLAVGSYRALGELLRVPMRGFTLLAFVSHKMLRWTLGFQLIGLAVSNLFLVQAPFYRIVLLAQLAFYAWAALGFIFRHSLRSVRFALIGYFLLAMNLAFLVGFIRFLVGRQEVTWQRVN